MDVQGEVFEDRFHFRCVRRGAAVGAIVVVRVGTLNSVSDGLLCHCVEEQCLRDHHIILPHAVPVLEQNAVRVFVQFVNAPSYAFGEKVAAVQAAEASGESLVATPKREEVKHEEHNIPPEKKQRRGRPPKQRSSTIHANADNVAPRKQLPSFVPVGDDERIDTSGWPAFIFCGQRVKTHHANGVFTVAFRFPNEDRETIFRGTTASSPFNQLCAKDNDIFDCKISNPGSKYEGLQKTKGERHCVSTEK